MSKISVTTIAGLTSGGDANKVKIESGDTLQVESNATVGGTANIAGVLTMSGNDFSNKISMANGGTGGTTFNMFSTSDAYSQPSANWMLHHSNASNGIILADQNGNVTMPSQPVFHVTRTSSQTTTSSLSTSTPVEFPSNTAPVPSTHFNHTNHRFTAPIAGKYMFQYGHATNAPAGASVYRAFLWKNGTRLDQTQLRVDSAGMTGYNFGSRSAILTLAANDYIHLNCSADNGGAFYADTQLRIYFQGYLLA